MGKNRKTPHISLDDSEMGIWNRSMELDEDDYSEDEVFKETAYSDGIERLELLAETPAGRFPYYEDYLTASKEQRKKERKRRKKLFHRGGCGRRDLRKSRRKRRSKEICKFFTSLCNGYCQLFNFRTNTGTYTINGSKHLIPRNRRFCKRRTVDIRSGKFYGVYRCDE